MDYSKSNLDTDIKSLKKAARSGAQEELKNRINTITKNLNKLELKEDCKIYWENKKVAELKAGKNYLNPLIRLITDDTLQDHDYAQLKTNLEKWLEDEKYIHLNDLLSIEKASLKNSFARGLSYQLFENNGVLERKEANEIIKNVSKQERFELRKKGIKIGKYHIYQPRMIRPNAVKFKSILWKCFNYKKDINYPNFGLNFLKNFKNKDDKFLRICGFETFGKFIIRVDILERLFLEILSRSKNFKFKLDAKIINLLGCTKDDFIEFIKILGYQLIKSENEPEFKFLPKKMKETKKKQISNAFSVLQKLKI